MGWIRVSKKVFSKRRVCGTCEFWQGGRGVDKDTVRIENQGTCGNPAILAFYGKKKTYGQSACSKWVKWHVLE